MLRAKRAFRGTLFIVIGARRVEWGLLAGKQWVGESSAELRIEPAEAGNTPLGALASALERLVGSWDQWRSGQSADAPWAVIELRVLVADTWLSVAGLPWSAALQQAGTAQAFVRAQLAAAGFDVAPDDVIRLDDAPFGQPLLAVAYPAPLLAALAKLAQCLATEVRSVLPFTVAAWPFRKAGQGKPGALAVVDEDLMLVAQGADRLTDVTVRPGMRMGLEGAEVARAVHGQWQRMRLRDPLLARLQQLQVLNLMPAWQVPTGAEAELVEIALHEPSAGAAASPRLQLAHRSQSQVFVVDAVPARRSMRPLHWVAAGVALLLTGALMLQASQTAAQTGARRAELEAAQGLVRPSPPAKGWSREELSRVRAVNAAIRELNLPISALLQALQPPRDIRVGVLSVEVAASAAGAVENETSGVKIIAEARTGAEMARYVGFVSERRPFSGAYLTRHEIVESAAERAYRFTVEATWRD